MSKKVLIIDDHQILRTGLAMIIETVDDLETVGTAVDGEDGLAKITTLHPDVIILDIRMPRLDGIAVLTAMKKQGITTPVVVLTTFDDQQPIRDALRLGAKGFLLKDADRETILKTIRGALKGEVFLEPQIAAKAFAAPATAQYRLTEREHEILTQVAQGYRNKEIADHLHLSERTIKSHLTDIYNQFGVFTRAEAVAFALQNELIKLD